MFWTFPFRVEIIDVSAGIRVFGGKASNSCINGRSFRVSFLPVWACAGVSSNAYVFTSYAVERRERKGRRKAPAKIARREFEPRGARTTSIAAKLRTHKFRVPRW